MVLVDTDLRRPRLTSSVAPGVGTVLTGVDKNRDGYGDGHGYRYGYPP